MLGMVLAASVALTPWAESLQPLTDPATVPIRIGGRLVAGRAMLPRGERRLSGCRKKGVGIRVVTLICLSITRGVALSLIAPVMAVAPTTPDPLCWR